jgi:hypothetical protein
MCIIVRCPFRVAVVLPSFVFVAERRLTTLNAELSMKVGQETPTRAITKIVLNAKFELKKMADAIT